MRSRLGPISCRYSFSEALSIFPTDAEEARAPVNNKLPALFPETVAGGFPPWDGKRNIHIFLEGQEVNCSNFGYDSNLALLWAAFLAAVSAGSSHTFTPDHCRTVTPLPGSAKAKHSQKISSSLHKTTHGKRLFLSEKTESAFTYLNPPTTPKKEHPPQLKGQLWSRQILPTWSSQDSSPQTDALTQLCVRSLRHSWEGCEKVKMFDNSSGNTVCQGFLQANWRGSS